MICPSVSCYLLIYFISAAVILVASLALMVQFSMPHNKVGRASELYYFILVFFRVSFGLNTLYILLLFSDSYLICYQCPSPSHSTKKNSLIVKGIYLFYDFIIVIPFSFPCRRLKIRPAFSCRNLAVIEMSSEWVTGPGQGKSSGRIATFSLWTGVAMGWHFPIPDRSYTAMTRSSLPRL
jgi:hypothetical protein